ncbi:digestive organ expansion factor [Entophlyctis helioformis]|nr:digestive organ expansion factor [Entophlyctis helioformis]
MTSVLKDTPSASHFSIDDLDTDRSLVADLDVKNRIAEKWPDVNGKITKKTGGDSFTPLQKALFPLMNSYADLLYTNQDFKFRKDITNLMALHALNHVYKANDRVIRNTTKLKAELAENKPASDLRDQGFTRPKVLIIQPFRNNAFEVIQTLIALSGTKTQDNKKRFMDEFGSDPADEKRESKKPDEYRKIFAGNVDDCFRVGIKFSRKHMKLFSDFYASDIIVASPLGLKLVIGADGQEADFDFLSSIEVVIVDMADVLLMQNWDHVRAVFDHLNLIPNNAHDCDFSRVRSYTLDGRSKYVRQNLIFARYATPEINALQSAYSKNVGGRIRISRPYRGTISDVVVSIPQLFHRMPPHALSAGPDARFAYFIEKILPTLRQSVVQQSHTLIVVPSYFDFVRLRNYLAEHNYHQVGPISEYTSRSEADSYRHRFAKGVGGGGEELTDIAYLLVTERYHFFRRPVIKGVRHVVFYQLPQNAGFYAELVNQVDASAGEVTCSVVYSAADKMVLERVVGSDRVERMIKGQKDTYLFTS